MYCWVVFCSNIFLLCCVMSSRLFLSRVLSGCSRPSSERHCCVVPCVDCHWHRYVLLIACTPHLSFMVMVFTLVMMWIALPRVDCVCVFGYWVLLEGVGCSSGGRGWVLWSVDGGRVGNSTLACCSASLIVFGVCLYMVPKSYGVSMAILSLFCICVIVVMP